MRIQQIQTNNAVAVNVRVHRNRTLGRRAEDDLRRLDRVGGRESEAQPVEVCGRVERVVQHGDVHLPFFQVWGGDEGYAWGEGALDLVGGGVRRGS